MVNYTDNCQWETEFIWGPFPKLSPRELLFIRNKCTNFVVLLYIIVSDLWKVIRQKMSVMHLRMEDGSDDMHHESNTINDTLNLWTEIITHWGQVGCFESFAEFCICFLPSMTMYCGFSSHVLQTHIYYPAWIYCVWYHKGDFPISITDIAFWTKFFRISMAYFW